MLAKRIKVGLAITLTTELFTKVMLFIFDALLASWLIVNDFAYWGVIYIFIKFAPYWHFGVLSYFNKRYPLLLGRKLKDKSLKVSLKIYSIFVFLSIITFIIALVLFLLGYIGEFVFLVLVVVSFMQMFSFYQAKLRADANFVEYSIGAFIQAAVQLVLAFMFLKDGGISAALYSILSGYFLSCLYYFCVSKLSLTLISFRSAMRVAWLGFLPFTLTITSFGVQMADRISIAAFGSDRQLAFYGFFFLFTQLSIVAVNSLGKVFGPYIIYLIGGAKNRISENANIEYIIKLNFYIVIIINLVAVTLLSFCFDYIALNFFSNYKSGKVGAISYLTVGSLLSMMMVLYPHLIALGKEKVVIYINCLHFTFLTIFLYLSVLFKPGVEWFPIVSLFVNSVFCYLFIWYGSKILNLKLTKVLLLIKIALLLSVYNIIYIVI